MEAIPLAESPVAARLPRWTSRSRKHRRVTEKLGPLPPVSRPHRLTSHSLQHLPERGMNLVFHFFVVRPWQPVIIHALDRLITALVQDSQSRDVRHHVV